jgi:hypothetical protein
MNSLSHNRDKYLHTYVARFTPKGSPRDLLSRPRFTKISHEEYYRCNKMLAHRNASVLLILIKLCFNH